MKKSLPIIAILALLTIVGFALFFANQAKLAENEEVLQDQIKELRDGQMRLAEIESDLRSEMAESDQIAKEALEAKQMAEAAAEKERLERERLVSELNTRLQREAEERREAEVAQLELQEKMAELEEAQNEAQAALAELEKTRTEKGDEPTEEEQALNEKVEEQLAQLDQLKEENKALKERTTELEQKQIATEEAIVDAGGRVELAYPEIRSPNIKRRQAILFKQRIAGHSDPED